MKSGFGSVSHRVAVSLVLCMLIASLSPVALAGSGQKDIGPAVMSGDLTDFTPSIEGKQYMFTEDSEPVFSATGHLKMEWRDAGYPGLVLPFSPGYLSSKSSMRACSNAWSQGDTGNISTAAGTVAVTAQKVSTNSAILVENGQVIPSTTINDLSLIHI